MDMNVRLQWMSPSVLMDSPELHMVSISASDGKSERVQSLKRHCRIKSSQNLKKNNSAKEKMIICKIGVTVASISLAQDYIDSQRFLDLNFSTMSQYLQLAQYIPPDAYI